MHHDADLLPSTEGSFEPGTDYLYNKIYSHTGNVKPCVRLLHREGEVGCSGTFPKQKTRNEVMVKEEMVDVQ